MRTTKLLLQAIRLHALNRDEADYQQFCADLNSLEQRLEADPYSEALIVTGAAIRALEEYNRRLDRGLERRQRELQAVVAMLTETMGKLAVTGQRAVKRIHDIEKQLEKASEVDDLRTLRLRLADCLKDLRAETRLRAEETRDHLSDLELGVARTKGSLARGAVGPDRDALTGLRQRQQAEGALAEALTEGTPTHAVVCVVQRLAAVNSRYGFGAGDRVLTRFAQQLSQGFGSEGHVYRWSGAAFLVLLERESRGEIQEEVSRLARSHTEEILKIGERTVLIPVSAKWMVVALSEAASVDELAERIDAFVKSHSGS